MDNASKAIIMAGAVLIAIGLVGLGVYMFQNASRLVEDQDSQIDAQQIMSINSTFTKYGTKCLGVDVVSLVRTVQTHNLNHSDYPVKIKNNGTVVSNIDNYIKGISSIQEYTIDYEKNNNAGIIDAINIK